MTHFENHAGYSGLVFGLPVELVQLEFTEREDGLSPAPTAEDLFVLYFADAAAVDERVARLARFGYETVPSENPYWDTVVRGFTVVDPDGFRIVLVDASASGRPGVLVRVAGVHHLFAVGVAPGDPTLEVVSPVRALAGTASSLLRSSARPKSRTCGALARYLGRLSPSPR